MKYFKAVLLQAAAVLTSSAAAMLFSCSCVGQEKELHLTLTNPTDVDRLTETVELPLSDIYGRAAWTADKEFKIIGPKGEEYQYQLTSGKTLIFQTALKASEVLELSIVPGERTLPDTLAYGQIYPRRFEDLAWENDKIAFRAYGPALQKRGDQAFGYDIFTKRGTSEVVLPGMYALETSKEIKEQIKRLKVTDPAKAEEVHRMRSYHVDKGHGMDCYAVGPTLGAGAAAIVSDGEILYPWCYSECEFLENGPLRFKVRLTFTPMEVGDSQVVESRIITLDAGSYFNKTTVFYDGLDDSVPMVSGIVIHDGSDQSNADASEGWISYVDPTTGSDNGQIFIGHAYNHSLTAAGAEYSEKLELTSKGKALGHVLAHDNYSVANGYTYWWGFGWDRADMPDFDAWNAHLATFARQLRSPLQISFND